MLVGQVLSRFILAKRMVLGIILILTAPQLSHGGHPSCTLPFLHPAIAVEEIETCPQAESWLHNAVENQAFLSCGIEAWSASLLNIDTSPLQAELDQLTRDLPRVQRIQEDLCSSADEGNAPVAGLGTVPKGDAPSGAGADATIDDTRTRAYCVAYEQDANFAENRRTFLVNNCASQVVIIDRETGELSYSLNPGDRGIAFPSWSAWFR